MVTEDPHAGAVCGDDGTPVSHPALPAMRRFLQAGAASAAATANAATAGANAAAAGSGPDRATAAAAAAAEVRSDIEPTVVELWAVITAGGEDEEGQATPAVESLGLEEVEELVLAHLCEYPAFLADVLLEAPLRQVALGQAFLAADDRRLDAAEARRRLAPNLLRHRETAARIASEACTHLMRRSEDLAKQVLRAADLDGDGVVSYQEFAHAVRNALVVIIENPALAAGVEALLADPNYGDDFHTAMAEAMMADADDAA
eukprot:gnl/TRDRNA2_/TRDRNA2_194920_c0_seq1.p1 gnl/TRDRNA2_/TRDRNA2_194920_c0~~gnl/TRDRNA2_/TRDRNA2_194920_c0_seq1.p1  ORF type:complete len:260 (+),score=59.83 gnl/TRDRNA2_/TRDRNA2_194920_c0_seq1:70-849(+)